MGSNPAAPTRKPRIDRTFHDLATDESLGDKRTDERQIVGNGTETPEKVPNDVAQKFAAISAAFARAPVDVRGEWLLQKLRPAYARLPGGASAVVGRGKFDDLDQTCDAMDAAAQRAWFGELISIAFPVENPRADQPKNVVGGSGGAPI